jgi:predicted oxidoreductase
VCDQRPNHTIKSYNTSKDHITQSVENSLRYFHTDYLDLLLIHRPDPLLCIEEVASTFEALYEAGKVRAFGVSNFTPSQFNALHSAYPLVTNQIECSLTAVEPFVDGTLDQAQEYGLKPMAWSPLGGGKLFGNDLGEREQRIVTSAQPLMEKYGVSLDVLLLNWLLLHPTSILPVLGTTKIERIQQSVKALSFTLTREEWFSLYEASRGYAVP